MNNILFSKLEKNIVNKWIPKIQKRYVINTPNTKLKNYNIHIEFKKLLEKSNYLEQIFRNNYYENSNNKKQIYNTNYDEDLFYYLLDELEKDDCINYLKNILDPETSFHYIHKLSITYSYIENMKGYIYNKITNPTYVDEVDLQNQQEIIILKTQTKYFDLEIEISSFNDDYKPTYNFKIIPKEKEMKNTLSYGIMNNTTGEIVKSKLNVGYLKYNTVKHHMKEIISQFNKIKHTSYISSMSTNDYTICPNYENEEILLEYIFHFKLWLICYINDNITTFECPTF